MKKKYNKKEKTSPPDNKLSVIIHLHENEQSISLLTESLTKLKAKNLSSFNFFFIDNGNNKALNKKIQDIIENLHLEGENHIDIIKYQEHINICNALRETLDKTTDDKIAFLDARFLSYTISFIDLLNLRTPNQENSLVIPEFVNRKNKSFKETITPFFGIDKRNLKCLLEHFDPSQNDFYYQLHYYAKRLGMEYDKAQFNQPYPFSQDLMANHHIQKKPLKSFINYFVSFPLKEFRSKHVRAVCHHKEPAVYRFTFACIATFLFILMPFMGYFAGISGDEYVNYNHAEYVFDYFLSYGKDSAALNTPKTMLQYYGQSFDNITAIINKTLNIEQEYEMRHVLNSMVGWMAILFAALIATVVAGWRSGIIVMLLMFISPRFIGHSWNNPKDIPFAAAYIFTLYYLIRFLQRFPRPGIKISLLLALGIAFAISVRIGGLLLIAYVFMFGGLYFLITSNKGNLIASNNLNRLVRLFVLLLGISVIGYFAGLILWPYALEDPINHPMKALEEMTHFSASLRQVFEGNLIWSDNVPWYYSPKYIFISIPLSVIAGFIFFLFLKSPSKNKLQVFFQFILLFAFIFPIFYIIYKKSNVYGGWRHLIFAYPPLVVLAGLGIDKFFNKFKDNNTWIGIFIIILLSIHPFLHVIKNHPYQYIYYNEMAGGIKGAYGKYEMDYYYHSLKEASEWLITNKIKNKSDTLIIAANGNIEYLFRDYPQRVKTTYVRYYERGNQDWDYAIIANSYISPYQLKQKIWPPENTIHQIEVNKKPVCAIIKRAHKQDLYGYLAMKNRNYSKAIQHLEKAIEMTPNNEVALLNLAKSYIDAGRYEDALKKIHDCLEIYPNYDRAINFIGIVYIYKKDYRTAIAVFNKIINQNEKFVGAYYNKGVVYYRMNDYNRSLNALNQALQVNSRYRPTYRLIARILQSQGKEEEAQKYIDAMNNLN